MANNGVSQHFKIDGGLDLTADSQFATLGANTKIVYKPNSEKYIKNSNYSNVFDKTISYATEGDLTDIKNEAIKSISNADANGKVTYTAINGSTGSFDCHVKVTDETTAASWGTKTKIATIDGKDISITLPSNPNTDTDTTYSAGTGLSLDGTTFNHNNYLDPQTPGYYHPCIAPLGLHLIDNVLSITGLSIRFNEQGHVTGFKNAEPVTVDLSSIAGSGESGGEAPAENSFAGLIWAYNKSTLNRDGTASLVPTNITDIGIGEIVTGDKLAKSFDISSQQTGGHETGAQESGTILAENSNGTGHTTLYHFNYNISNIVTLDPNKKYRAIYAPSVNSSSGDPGSGGGSSGDTRPFIKWVPGFFAIID